MIPLFINIVWVMFRLVVKPSDITPTYRLRDLTALTAFRLYLAKTMADPDTAATIRDRYLSPGPHDLEALAKLPEGTLGYSHAMFMKHFGIAPQKFPDGLLEEMRSGKASDETYLRMRAPETHDVWHCVLGIPPDGPGEMAIASFYLKQLNLPLAGILLAVGFLLVTFRKPYAYQELMEAIIKGWTMGGQSKPLMAVRWEQQWDRPIAEIRKELGIQVEVEAVQQPSEAAREQLAQQRFEAYASANLVSS